MEKAIVFIDGSNFYHGLKSSGIKGKVNFEKLTKKLCENYTLIKVYYYNAPVHQEKEPEQYKKQRKFFNYINSRKRFELILGRLETRKIIVPPDIYERIKDIHPEQILYTYAEKGVDINIAVDMVKMAYHNIYDAAILISGDGDFVPAVKVVQETGKKVINAYFGDKARKGYHLRKVCDEFIEFSKEYLKDCLKKETRGG